MKKERGAGASCSADIFSLTTIWARSKTKMSRPEPLYAPSHSNYILLSNSNTQTTPPTPGQCRIATPTLPLHDNHPKAKHPNAPSLQHPPHQPPPSQRSSAPNSTTPNNPTVFPIGSNAPPTPLIIVVSDGGFVIDPVVEPVDSALPEPPVVGDATVDPLATHPTHEPGRHVAYHQHLHYHHHPS